MLRISISGLSLLQSAIKRAVAAGAIWLWRSSLRKASIHSIRCNTIQIKNSWNAANITNNGHSIELSIAMPPDRMIEAGWCNVCHQSTENLTIGRFIQPIKASIEAIFAPFSGMSNPYLSAP